MKISNTTLIELKAEEGMILVGPDGYGATIYYLGVYDSPDNYTEIPIEDYIEPEQPEVLKQSEELEQPEVLKQPEELEQKEELPEPPDIEEPKE